MIEKQLPILNSIKIVIIVSHDFQLSYLQAYFGNKASYYVCKLDVIEERLGLPKWQNTKR